MAEGCKFGNSLWSGPAEGQRGSCFFLFFVFLLPPSALLILEEIYVQEAREWEWECEWVAAASLHSLIDCKQAKKSAKKKEEKIVKVMVHRTWQDTGYMYGKRKSGRVRVHCSYRQLPTQLSSTKTCPFRLARKSN